MKLGDRIRQLREECNLTQGQLAHSSAVSQGYLSQLENGEVKNPSAAVLLRVAEAMQINADELFEAAGYPTVRTLRRLYQDYESTVDDALLHYLAGLSREKQRRLLSLLQGIEKLIVAPAPREETWNSAETPAPAGNVTSIAEFSKVGN